MVYALRITEWIHPARSFGSNEPHFGGLDDFHWRLSGFGSSAQSARKQAFTTEAGFRRV